MQKPSVKVKNMDALKQVMKSMGRQKVLEVQGSSDFMNEDEIDKYLSQNEDVLQMVESIAKGEAIYDNQGDKSLKPESFDKMVKGIARQVLEQNREQKQQSDIELQQLQQELAQDQTPSQENSKSNISSQEQDPTLNEQVKKQSNSTDVNNNFVGSQIQLQQKSAQDDQYRQNQIQRGIQQFQRYQQEQQYKQQQKLLQQQQLLPFNNLLLDEKSFSSLDSSQTKFDLLNSNQPGQNSFKQDSQNLEEKDIQFSSQQSDDIQSEIDKLKRIRDKEASRKSVDQNYLEYQEALIQQLINEDEREKQKRAKRQRKRANHKKNTRLRKQDKNPYTELYQDERQVQEKDNGLSQRNSVDSYYSIGDNGKDSSNQSPCKQSPVKLNGSQNQSEEGLHITEDSQNPPQSKSKIYSKFISPQQSIDKPLSEKQKKLTTQYLSPQNSMEPSRKSQDLQQNLDQLQNVDQQKANISSYPIDPSQNLQYMDTENQESPGTNYSDNNSTSTYHQSDFFRKSPSQGYQSKAKNQQSDSQQNLDQNDSNFQEIAREAFQVYKNNTPKSNSKENQGLNSSTPQSSLKYVQNNQLFNNKDINKNLEDDQSSSSQQNQRPPGEDHYRHDGIDNDLMTFDQNDGNQSDVKDIQGQDQDNKDTSVVEAIISKETLIKLQKHLQQQFQMQIQQLRMDQKMQEQSLNRQLQEQRECNQLLVTQQQHMQKHLHQIQNQFVKYIPQYKPVHLQQPDYASILNDKDFQKGNDQQLSASQIQQMPKPNSTPNMSAWNLLQQQKNTKSQSIIQKAMEQQYLRKQQAQVNSQQGQDIQPRNEQSIYNNQQSNNNQYRITSSGSKSLNHIIASHDQPSNVQNPQQFGQQQISAQDIQSQTNVNSEPSLLQQQKNSKSQQFLQKAIEQDKIRAQQSNTKSQDNANPQVEINQIYTDRTGANYKVSKYTDQSYNPMNRYGSTQANQREVVLQSQDSNEPRRMTEQRLSVQHAKEQRRQFLLYRQHERLRKHFDSKSNDIENPRQDDMATTPVARNLPVSTYNSQALNTNFNPNQQGRNQQTDFYDLYANDFQIGRLGIIKDNQLTKLLFQLHKLEIQGQDLSYNINIKYPFQQQQSNDNTYTNNYFAGPNIGRANSVINNRYQQNTQNYANNIYNTYGNNNTNEYNRSTQNTQNNQGLEGSQIRESIQKFEQEMSQIQGKLDQILSIASK